MNFVHVFTVHICQVLEELAERDLSEVIPMLIEKIKQVNANEFEPIAIALRCAARSP